MKKLLLFFVAVLLVSTAIAQTTYHYDFFHNLKETESVGGDLTASCPGTYTTEMLPVGINRVVYNFPKACGLVFADTKGLLASGSYTIELYFSLDQIAGYNKVIDFKDRAFDDGLYNWNGHFNLYPNYTTAGSIMAANKFHYLAITRDAGTQQMRFYHDGNSIGSYVDKTNVYLYDGNQKLTFFQDDTVSKTEHSSGSIAMLRITDQPLDHTSIQNNFSNLAVSLSIKNTPQQVAASVYPNPTTQYINITNRQGHSYAITDMVGRSLKEGTIAHQTQVVNTSQLPTGVYLLQLYDKRGNKEHHVIRKE
ncbi:MAG: LamG-like jellyroll fold domain-containing protein [Flavipsychrobacter sp.]